MTVLVTGANGYIGSAVVATMNDRAMACRGSVRAVADDDARANRVGVGDIGPDTDWSVALEGVDCVLHLAARAHVIKEQRADALAEFRRVNVEGTRTLAEQAARSGVARFVYVSSIGVLGQHTSQTPFDEQSEPAPVEDYARSKLEAEQVLLALAEREGFELVIVRPPLVYGPGAPGNMARLLRLVRSGIPLPLGSIDNARNMISLRNLVEALLLCVTHRAAAGETFVVADEQACSTPQLIGIIADAMQIPSRVFACPVRLLELMGALTGQSGAVRRLVDSLEVNSGKVQRLLGWSPGQTLEQGVAESVQAFNRQYR